MMFRCMVLVGWLLTSVSGWAQETYHDLADPPHDYWTRTPNDRFTRIKAKLESGEIPLNREGGKALLLDLLKVLEVPVHSQLLVFSATSLQSERISTRNPRAIYFNEDTYVGYIPGGKIEIISMDPDLGAIFYIFDIPKISNPAPVRSRRCMNCHSGMESGHVPGISLKSVIPGPNGGSMTAFRTDRTGHDIPMSERFGGWYVTGGVPDEAHRGNREGNFIRGDLEIWEADSSPAFRSGKYPVSTSDVLAHLLLEHQAGFVNRTVEAAYRARTWMHVNGGKLTPEHARDLDEQADSLVQYLLFKGEMPLPKGGVKGVAAFKEAFLADRRSGPGGRSLKDFDLKERLFRHRCSYMIYSPSFEGLPPVMKQRVFERLRKALDAGNPDPEFGYLPAEEKRAIRGILAATVEGFPVK